MNNKAICKAIARAPAKVYTLTLDNGKENCGHRLITALTNVRCYFTDPGCPGQKGMIENIIGVLRQFIGKGDDLSRLTPRRLQKIADWFNDRPMKRLNFRTPREVYYNIA